MESVVVDAEVVGDLVEDGHADLGTEFVVGEAEGDVRLVEDDDLVGCVAEVVDTPFGQRDAFVDAEDAVPRRVLLSRRDVLHNDGEVVDALDDPRRKLLENCVDDPCEFPPIHRPSLDRVGATLAAPGRLAQRESAAFTRQRSLVRSQ